MPIHQITIWYAACIWYCFQLSGDVCVGGVWDLRPWYVNHQIQRRKPRLAIACQSACLTRRSTALRHKNLLLQETHTVNLDEHKIIFHVRRLMFNPISIRVRLITGLPDTYLGFLLSKENNLTSNTFRVWISHYNHVKLSYIYLLSKNFCYDWKSYISMASTHNSLNCDMDPYMYLIKMITYIVTGSSSNSQKLPGPLLSAKMKWNHGMDQ